MKIEKVCRYVPIVQGLKSQGVQAGSTMRQMLLSIPRVRFLEGGDNDYYDKFKSPDDDPNIENPTYTTAWCNAIKTLPITESELIAERMVNDGATQQQVADRLGILRGSVANIVNRVRVKRAYQSLKK
jgi:hypothetical protein